MPAANAPAPAPVEETLAWEAEQAPRAGTAAVLAGVLSLIGFFLGIYNARQVPEYSERQVGLLDVLRRSAEGEAPGVPGRLAAQVAYLGEHSTLPIIAAALSTLSLLLLFPVLGYLFRAAGARRPQYPRWGVAIIATGVVLFSVTYGILNIGVYLDARDFASEPAERQTNLLASDVIAHEGRYAHGAYGVAGAFGVLGSLGTGLSFVLVSIAAMRVGLLTRFMGILGAIVGATFVLPLDQPGVIRSFWMIAVGLLVLGRWPSGRPPAWQTGREEPWPTQQELREARQRAQGKAEPAAPPAAPPEDAAGAGTSRSRKKRKKR